MTIRGEGDLNNESEVSRNKEPAAMRTYPTNCCARFDMATENGCH